MTNYQTGALSEPRLFGSNRGEFQEWRPNTTIAINLEAKAKFKSRDGGNGGNT